MQAVLVMFRSDGERRSFSITRDVTVIGRREDCDLRIPVNDVSRKHARLIREGEELRLEDLGSSNGTHVNGHRIERDAIVQAGDSIQVGPVVFVLQVDGYPADEELHPITAETAAAAAMMAPSAVPVPPGMEGVGGEEAMEEPLEPLDEMPVEGGIEHHDHGHHDGGHHAPLYEAEHGTEGEELLLGDEHAAPLDDGLDDLMLDIEPESHESAH